LQDDIHCPTDNASDVSVFVTHHCTRDLIDFTMALTSFILSSMLSLASLIFPEQTIKTVNEVNLVIYASKIMHINEYLHVVMLVKKQI